MVHMSSPRHPMCRRATEKIFPDASKPVNSNHNTQVNPSYERFVIFFASLSTSYYDTSPSPY